MFKIEYRMVGTLLFLLLLLLMVNGCTSVPPSSAESETQVIPKSTGPISSEAWAKAIDYHKDTYGTADALITIVEASDGHDYLTAWAWRDGIATLHAAGCRECNRQKTADR